MRLTRVIPIFFSVLVLISCTGRSTSATVPERVSAEELETMAEPQSLNDKFSYVYGYKMSATLSDSFTGINPNYVALGALDYVDGISIFSEDEMDQIINEYQIQIYQRAEELFNQLREENLAQAEAFLRSNGERSVVTTLSDGIQVEVLRQGSGATPGENSTVTVNYQLTTLDGSVMDSTYSREGGSRLSLANTIPGFRTVLTNMKEGERIRAWIHPSEGYGEYGNGNIGPNQLLIFDIELLSVND